MKHENLLVFFPGLVYNRDMRARTVSTALLMCPLLLWSPELTEHSDRGCLLTEPGPASTHPLTFHFPNSHISFKCCF